MSFNPSELTEQLGQKAGQYAAAYFNKGGEGGGFIAQAQHKFISEQVGNIVTTQVNEFFHIENTGKKKVTDEAKKPSGGFMGGVNEMFNKDDEGPSENHIPPSERVGQKKEGGGFLGQAKEFAEQIFGGDEGSNEDHIPSNNRVGQPGYQARDAYTVPVNQGGQMGEPSRNYTGNNGPNQNYPTSGGYPGDHIPSDIPVDQRIGQTNPNYGNYENQQQQGQGGYYGGQQQPGEFYGNQQQQGQGVYYGNQQQQQGGYYQGQQQQGGYYQGQQQGGYGQQNPDYPYNQVEGSYQ